MAMNEMTYDTRAGELLALAAAEGVHLPYPVGDILALEDAGFVVDLVTGEVFPNGGAITVTPTVLAEVWALLERVPHASEW